MAEKGPGKIGLRSNKKESRWHKVQPKLLVHMWQMNTWNSYFIAVVVVVAAWWGKLSCCGWEDESVVHITSLGSSPPSPDPMYKARPDISSSSINVL